MFCGFGDPEAVKFDVPLFKINTYLLTVKDEIQVLTLSSHNGVIIARLLKHLFVSVQLFYIFVFKPPVF